MAKKKDNNPHDKRQKVIGILLVLLALLLLVSLSTHYQLDDQRITGQIDNQFSPFKLQYHNQGGLVGAYLSYFALVLFGWLSFFLPFGLILISFRLFSKETVNRLKINGLVLFIGSLIGTMIYNIHLIVSRQLSLETGAAGGLVTEKLTRFFIKLIGELGSYIFFAGLILILLLIYTPVVRLLSVKIKLPFRHSEIVRKRTFIFLKSTFSTVKGVFRNLFSFKRLISIFESDETSGDSDDESNSFQDVLEKEIEQNSIYSQPPHEVSESEKKLPRRKATIVKQAEPLQVKSMKYEYPHIKLLTENPNKGSSVNSDEINFTARMLKETLETFNIRIEGEIQKFPGPIITRYEFKPGAGIKVNQIINLSDDLALALKARRIRIIAPIPGKAAVGVEIPNRNPQMVYLRDIIESDEFRDSKLKLPLALGKTTSGKPFVADLTKMPHLLIAGATGSGKSVGMNVMITSLLYRLHPYQVRFIFIDPKMLELSIYSGIPHMARPVVTKPKRAERVLSDAVTEMEKRYRKLANASVRNIVDYNKKQKSQEDTLPYIVICVDELADLMMSSTSSKTEMLITRLAQMSRAVGIHLVLATQRPSVDVITGLIKANFPSRIAFQVSSKVDSRTIIDANGAEKLLGAGDMLFLYTGHPEALRIHGAYLSSNETEVIVKSIKEQGLEMLALEGITQATGEATEVEIDFGDPLFKEACEVVIRHKQGSVSLLQRRLGIGYQRAARLIDKLEQAGIVSPFDGSKAREVLVDKSYIDTIFSNPNQIPQTNSEKN
ncbi:MAG: DNA translocase FtsK [FCB group bacterium]|nr:DNA translocase FtsK [FCB group bacterium]